MRFTRYMKEIAEISAPIIMGNLGFIFIGVGDVIVAGRHSTETLAAVSIANAILNCIMMIGIGILSAVAPIVSNMRGEGQQPEKYFYPTVKFALVMSLFISLCIFATVPIIDRLGYEPELAKLIKTYSIITAFSTFGVLLHSSIKDFLQSFEIVLFPNILTVIAVFLNLGLNIIFVFGYFGLPEMGVAGLALASLITRYIMGFGLYFYALYRLSISMYTDTSYYKNLLIIGTPIAFAILIEFVAFNLVTVIMGRISGLYAAAQNIVSTLTTVSFMVPLAIANGLSVKVGYSNGAKDYLGVRRFAVSGIIMSEIFMFCSAVTVASFPHFWIGLFTPDKELIAVTVPIVYILALFQIFDGMQVTLAGIFKGLKDTNIVMLANFISYWIVSLPLGTLLAFRFNLNIMGYWYAIGVAAVLLCIIMITKLILKYREWQKLAPADYKTR